MYLSMSYIAYTHAYILWLAILSPVSQILLQVSEFARIDVTEADRKVAR